MSRKMKATITYSEWEAIPSDNNDPIYWLTVKTDQTGERKFRLAGSTEKCLSFNQPHYEKFTIGNIIEIGQLHTIPVIRDWLAAIEPGVNLHVGIMDDGLTDICGPLIFTRLVNLTDRAYNPSDDLMDTGWQAAKTFADSGREAAKRFLETAGLEVYQFQIGGPSLNDDCVVERW